MTRRGMTPTITVHLRIRTGGPQRDEPPGWLEVTREVPGDWTVVELLEAIKGDQHPCLVFRHSCHHGSCGTCAMRIAGEVRLACTTGLAEVVRPGGVLVIEPLNNMPWLADLAADAVPLMEMLEALGPGHVRPDPGLRGPELPATGLNVDAAAGQGTADAGAVAGAAAGTGAAGDGTAPPVGRILERFGDCIECGACVAACPVANPAQGYVGPAPLLAARDAAVLGLEPGTGWDGMAAVVDGPRGVWQCHQAFECSRVCPAEIDVAGALMALRRLSVAGRLRPPSPFTGAVPVGDVSGRAVSGRAASGGPAAGGAREPGTPGQTGGISGG